MSVEDDGRSTPNPNALVQYLSEQNSQLKETIRQMEVKYSARLHQVKRTEKELREIQQHLTFEKNFYQERLKLVEEENEKLKREFRIERNLRKDFESDFTTLFPEFEALKAKSETTEKDLTAKNEEIKQLNEKLENLKLSQQQQQQQLEQERQQYQQQQYQQYQHQQHQEPSQEQHNKPTTPRTEENSPQQLDIKSEDENNTIIDHNKYNKLKNNLRSLQHENKEIQRTISKLKEERNLLLTFLAEEKERFDQLLSKLNKNMGGPLSFPISPSSSVTTSFDLNGGYNENESTKVEKDERLPVRDFHLLKSFWEKNIPETPASTVLTSSATPTTPPSSTVTISSSKVIKPTSVSSSAHSVIDKSESKRKSYIG